MTIGLLLMFSLCASVLSEPLLTVHTRLLRELLGKYDKRILPQTNASEPVSLAVGLRLINLVELFEREEVLETGVYVQQMWTDVRLGWDPSRYDRIQVVHMPVADLWQPDIALYNNADVKFETMDTLAVVFHTGLVFYSPKARIRTRCDVDMTRFPYDQQSCTIKIGSFTYDGNRINLTLFTSTNESLDMNEYTINKEWSIENTSATIRTKSYSCCQEHYQHLEYTLLLKRNPVYYTHVFVLPAVILALLIPFQFVLPPDSKERVTLGGILLLSVFLLMAQLQDFLPEAHPNLPNLVQYYCITLVWISMSLACSIWVINTHERGPRKRKVPAFIRQIFLKSLKKLVCLGDDTYYPLDESETISMRGLDKQIINLDVTKQDSTNKLERDIEEILRHVHTIVVKCTTSDARHDVCSEWHQVVIVFDRILCFMFILTVVIYSCVLLS